MNVQRGIIPALIIGGIAAVSAAVVAATRSGTGSSRRRSAGGRPATARVTENGRKYHAENCPLLHGAYRTIPMIEAMLGYEPCKACHRHEAGEALRES